VRSGSAWAKAELFHRNARAVNALAVRLLGRNEDVDDLVQDSFVQAFSSLDQLRDPDAFGAWLSTIVVHAAQKRHRRHRLLQRLGFCRASALEIERLVSPSAPPEVLLELRRVYGILEQLPANLRVPFVLRKVDALEVAKIAELTGSSLATVKRRIARAEALFNLQQEPS